MYTSKFFKEMVPESFLTPDEVIFKKAIQQRLYDLEVINSIKDTKNQSFFNRVKFERFSDKECELINIVNRAIQKRYIDSMDIEDINTVEDMINEIVIQTSVVYGWYKDTQIFKEYKNKSFKKAKEYEKNYWFFMEWQSDLFNFTMAVFMLGGEKLPDNLKINIKCLMQNYDILCGINLIYSNKELLDMLYDNLNTIYSWVHIEDQNDWINNDMPNSKKETFEEHLKFWIKLIKFVEKITTQNELTECVYTDFQKILTNKYLEVI